MSYICRHCNNTFENFTPSQAGNHSRWCIKNPKLSDYKSQIKSITNSENQYTKARKLGLSIPISPNKGKPSHNKGMKDSEETVLKKQVAASKATHRRLCRSIREYTTIDGDIVMLDSSWEEMLARRLDSLGVRWIRPSYINWIDKFGKIRKYFPDFYLTDFDLLIDPKNPTAYNQQIEKVTWLKENVKNLIFLLTVEEINNFSPDSSMKEQLVSTQ